jgi:rubrerythrin
MDFKKFGWMLVLLGGVLASVAGYYSMIPYINRWDDWKVIAEATNAGYATSEYIAMKAARAVDAQRVFGFGWAAAISAFLGFALITSSKKSSQIYSTAVPSQSAKTYWVCGKCNETTETAKNICWSCGAPKA